MQRRRTVLTEQQQIANLMLEDYGSNLGQDPAAGPARMPSDPPSMTQVSDGVSQERHTEMRQCAAIECANNLRGRSCGLAAIEVNQRGACDSYEPRGASRYDDEGAPTGDEETIIGISALMPSEVDVPSGRGNIAGMFGNFNPGTPY